MPNYAYATPQTELALAIETTRGTAGTTLFWTKVMAPKYKPDLTLNPDEALMGSEVQTYNLVPGLRYDAHSWNSYPYLDTFPVFLRALLGSTDTVTTAPSSTTLSSAAAQGATSVSTAASIAAGSYIVIGPQGNRETHLTTAVSGAGPYTVTLATPLIFAQASGATVTGLTKHEIGLLNDGGEGNQSPTVTITDYAGDAWRQLTAGTLDTLTIKGNATGIVTYECGWFANASTTPSAPSTSFSNVQAVPGWTSQIVIGGSQVPYYVDWEFDLKRGVKPIPALTGSQQYFLYFQGALQATGKITVILQSGAPELTAYEAGTQQSFDFTVNDVASGYALNLHSTLAEFQSTEGLDRSKEWVEVPLDFQLLPSSTDAVAGGVSPIVTTVANAQTTSY